MATYHEIIIKGDDNVVDGYLKGFLAGRGVKSGFYFSKDWPFRLGHIREIIKYRGPVVHVICSGSLRATITSAVDKSDLEIEVETTRKIDSLSFGFNFMAANREVAASIKRTLGRLPAGVKLEDYAPEESVDPDAKGVEAYSPVHDYEFKGEGKARGDVDGVLALYRKLTENRAFRVEEINIIA